MPRHIHVKKLAQEMEETLQHGIQGEELADVPGTAVDTGSKDQLWGPWAVHINRRLLLGCELNLSFCWLVAHLQLEIRTFANQRIPGENSLKGVPAKWLTMYPSSTHILDHKIHQHHRGLGEMLLLVVSYSLAIKRSKSSLANPSITIHHQKP